MRTIQISDRTLCRTEGTYSFKEKIGIARLLGNLQADVIELPAIENGRTDVLLVKTIASFVKHSVLSVETGGTAEGVAAAAAALESAVHPRMRVSLPVSAVGMEYGYHKKPAKMLDLIGATVAAAKEKCPDVEFCAVDATRADDGYLAQAMQAAMQAGASTVTICDDEGVMLPDDFGAFVAQTIRDAEVPETVRVGVMCRNPNGLAAANAVLAVKSGAQLVKTAVDGEITDLDTFATIVRNCGDNTGLACGLRVTELKRTVQQIRWISGATAEVRASAVAAAPEVHLDAHDAPSAVSAAVRMLGYDLSEEDDAKVYEEFKRVAEKKTVGAKELEAIVASTAMQVPPTYQLVRYVINSGNVISASAQICLNRDGRELNGIGMGDGPIDASFLTVEQIVGHHYELDDFQIQAVTEGKEAMGSALVKLRSNGKLYAGNGISTDIIGASIRAYLSALNKIVYEEA